MSEELIRQIPMAGVVHDLPNEVYHGISDAVSNSGLNDFARSPAHYFGRHLDPERPPRETKPGQLEGTLAHCALFEPGEFDRRYRVGPDVHKATNVWKAFKAECADMRAEPVDADQKRIAFLQAAQARSLPSVAKALAVGRPEVSVFWLDEETGVRCRARPDWVHPVATPHGEGVILIDGKTYSDASGREFSRQIERKAYHRQAAFYTDGYEAATAVQVMGFIFVAMETEWPFKANALMLGADDIQLGRNEYRALLERYAECRATGLWPGYGEDIELISLPRRGAR